MPTYKYTAKNKEGKTIAGNVNTANKEGVLEILREEELIPISIQEAKKGIHISIGGKKKVKLDDVAIFSRQLAAMVESGIPAVGALDALAQQMENKTFQEIIGKVRDDVETGSSFSQALSKHPSVFSSLYINMVKAGETSGKLDEILARLATYLEKINSLQRKVKSSLVYPTVVVFIAISITTFLLVKVVPTFRGIFDVLGGELPLPTVILLAVSDFVRHYFLLGIVGLILFVFLFSRYIKTVRGRYQFDAFLLKMPIFGPIFRKFSIAKFSRTLSSLVRSGVPILVSLDIVGKTCGNRVLEKAIEQAAKAIKDGKSIAEPLGESKILPPMAVRMISVGEQTGELEKMLIKIADFYDEQVEAAASSLISIIEPVIILFLGVVIGGIVLAIFMPIFKLTELVGR
ncbi:MAG: type II secretion system F family protein [Candidatus Omnitrophota bacterium]|nr:MAG: type II secretion system F family protein [Candidatus Omnitrophota bacterium]